MKSSFLLIALCGVAFGGPDTSLLESQFRNPPVTTRPYVWWHWMGSNFSKEGITKDLEAMKATGIGGATIFNIASAVQESHKPTLNNPWPDQTYRSPKYWEALRHAASEAQRLGLEIGLHNTVGYSTTGGPWIDEEKNMQKVVSKSVIVDGGKPISIEIPRPDPTTYNGYGNSGQKFTFFQDIAVLAVPAEGDIDPTQTIDLTTSFKNNRIEWNAPPGKWQIVRFSHAPTGSNPHPLPDELIGKTLEVDKISLEANQFHWDQVVDPMKEYLGPFLGKSFRHFLIDSYEAGAQNWTPKFREEFTKRKGYDPLPWLFTLEKRTVGNDDMSRRFKWDYDDVIRTLYYENGWMTAVKKIKPLGIDLQFEPYGGQFETVDGAALADIPMGEFWSNGGGGIDPSVVAAARAAGRTVVGAEAFTGPPDLSKWSETPAFLKKSADGSFASGANRLILHHWVHQPFDDKYKPGMGMGWWGTHFNRHQTWARDGVAFFQYIGRCQALLQSGESPSDFVSVGRTQGSDVISWRLFRNGVAVKNKRIQLPSGRSYPFLTIPHNGHLLPVDVEKIGSLLEQGATIVCEKPTGTPGLSGFPKADEDVKSSPLWTSETVRNIGKGTLYNANRPDIALRDLNVTPLTQIKGAVGIVTAARETPEGMVFFVANPQPAAANLTASFRTTGKRPELWDAMDGSIRFAPVWRQSDGKTEVDLQLRGGQSLFVVFRSDKLPADHAVSINSTAGGESPLQIITARFGTPTVNRWADVTAQLQELARYGSIQIPQVSTGFFRVDPASNIVKQLEIEYKLDGVIKTLTVKEGEKVSLSVPTAEPPPELVADSQGVVSIISSKAIHADVSLASGKHQTLEAPAPAPVIKLNGPWKVRLDSPVDESLNTSLSDLCDLSTSEDPKIRYFSGTAYYSCLVDVPQLKSGAILDLGGVRDLARVAVNGKDLGVLWMKPFRINISSTLKAGSNRIDISVTNTWHNRLVGDEQFPADFEWGDDRGDRGHAMKAYPDWFLKNQPRKEQGRKCFVVWYYHRPETKLLPSGLLGPVIIEPSSTTR